MTAIVSLTGPFPATGSVTRCDIGRESLDGLPFWLVRSPGRGWVSDQGAACFTHAAADAWPGSRAQVLTAVKVLIIDAVLTLMGEQHDAHAGRQRFVSLLDVRTRTAATVPAHLFDEATTALLADYALWGRVASESTLELDRASVRRNGTDYHLITADNWRDNVI